MKIRSVTCFHDPGKDKRSEKIESCALLAQEAAKRYQTRGFEVQTTRLATTPFPKYAPIEEPDACIAFIKLLEDKASSIGFAHLSCGPALPEKPESYALIPHLLRATQNAFFCGVMATTRTGVHLEAVHACARIISEASGIAEDGFTNLRFASLANVRPFAPFFPAAYQSGSKPGFSLAIECADIALNTFSRAISLSAARASLLKTLEDYARVLTGIADGLAQQFDVIFHGIDYSLAPFPQAWCSLGSAIERMGPPSIGMHGSLAAAAYIADTLDRGKWKRAGFNGLMLPVLEDSTLAERTASSLTIKDLLLFSAVCGTGLDTVPLPGCTTVDQIYALLLDVAALAVRLGKPLTARLMPIPGKEANETTEFKFSYFANGKVMPLHASKIEGALAGSEIIQLTPRQPRY
jgi:uncharacterized protein (UPF0210 family)